MLSRRSFTKALLALPLIPAATSALMWTQKAFAAALELIDMKQAKRKDAANATAVSIARSFDYVENSDKEPRLNASEKPGAGNAKVPPAKQTCSNCQYHVAPPGTDPKKKLGTNGGACQLIAGVLVHDKGWCKMWAFGQHTH